MDDPRCEFCGASKQTVQHLVWECPKFKQARDGISEVLSQWGEVVLTPAMKIGIMPPLMAGCGRSFWGCHPAEEQGPWVTLPPQVENYIGMHDELLTRGEAKEKAQAILDQATYGMAATDHVMQLKAKGGTTRLGNPEWINDTPPTEPNIYTDGSLYNSRSQELALGGVGIWWINQDHEPEDQQRMITHWRYMQDGLGMWNEYNSEWSSSTRCELAATLITTVTNRPIHTASDSKAMVDKANKYIAMAETIVDRIVTEHQEHGDQPRPHTQDRIKQALQEAAMTPPTKKPWALQKDGDLWSEYWRLLILRNPRATKHIKVKGHADDEMVAKGIIT